MFRVPASLVVPVLLLLTSPTWANFSALSSDGFTYCYGDAENTAGQNCVDSELVPGGDCARSCTVPGSSGGVSGRLPWGIDGFSTASGGDTIDASTATVRGERTSEAIFAVTGKCDSSVPGVYFTPEVALFRFDGDPAVFEGTSAVTISELVDLGLIDSADVLLVYDCEDTASFDFEVEVAGIPNEELIVFAGGSMYAGYPGIPMPAISAAGAALLALLLLGAGTAALRKRANRRRAGRRS